MTFYALNPNYIIVEIKLTFIVQELLQIISYIFIILDSIQFHRVGNSFLLVLKSIRIIVVARGN